MEKVLAMQGVANKLFAAERSIDKAMTDSAGLMTGMIAFREEQNVAATVGDEAVAKVAAAMAALSAARTAMVEAHAALDETKLRLGVRTKMSGQDKPTKPDFAFAADTREVHPLRKAG